MEVEQKDVIDDALDFTSEEYAVALGEKVCWGCDETAPYLGDGGPQPRKVAWSSLEKGHTRERETVDACCDGPRRGRRRDAEGGQTYKSWKRLWYSVHKDDPYNADQTYSMQEYRIRKKLQKRLQKDRFQSTHAGLTMVQDPYKTRGRMSGWVKPTRVEETGVKGGMEMKGDRMKNETVEGLEEAKTPGVTPQASRVGILTQDKGM
jgi:hypothetical protein